MISSIPKIGKYAANLEKATSLPADGVASPFTTYEKKETPKTETIAKLTQKLQCSPTNVVKNVLYQALYDSGVTVLVLISIRGDQDVNGVKLQNELVKIAGNYKAKALISLTVPDEVARQRWQSEPLPLGYIAPDLSDDYIGKVEKTVGKFLRFVDLTAVELKDFVTGANELDYHVVGANWGKEFTLPKMQVDIRKALVGDRGIHDSSQTLQTARGIEVGHIFQLGNKYSKAMKATYTDESGKEQPLEMGCYGIGVSRLAQSAVEQCHDKDGIIWPLSIAPYQVVVVVPNITNEEQMSVAEKLYQDLQTAGIEVLLDDRDARAGAKFKDADLIGIPYRIVTGRSLKEGKVEMVIRANKQSQNLAIDDVVTILSEIIKNNS